MHYVVNNTIYNLSGATWYGKTNNAFLNTNSLFENNLFISCKQEYKTDNPSKKPPGTWDYNYANNNILNRLQDRHDGWVLPRAPNSVNASMH